MLKILLLIITIIPLIKGEFKDHRPIYIPDKYITINSGLYNTKTRNLEESNTTSKLQFINPISNQYIISNGLLEYLTFTFKPVNLKSGYYFKYGSLKFPSSSNISIINVEFVEQDTNYTFSNNLLKFYFKLKKDQTLTIKLTLQYNENINSLFRSEYIYIPAFFQGTCKYTFEIINAKNLGLLYKNFDKLTPSSYYYNDECPQISYYDYIRTSPFKANWKIYKESNIIGNKITYTQLTIPKFFYGGNNYNYTEYNIESTETNVTNSIKDNNTHLIFTYKNISETKLTFKINSTFTNTISNNWTIYYSEDDIKNTSTEKSISLVNEILKNDTSENPSYYKIGMWLYYNLDYNSSYTGKKQTVDEIIEKKIGVCEHFTILYIALLNSIGIKAINIHGYSADSNNIFSNPIIDISYGHSWVLANINNNWIGLDATWGLVEGNLPISHLFYSAIYGSSYVKFKGNNVKWGSSIIDIEFLGISDVYCEDYLIFVDGECLLCSQVYDSKIYFDFNQKKCVSECKGGLYNYVCYDDCGELNYDDVVYENVNGFCVQKSEVNNNSSENENDNSSGNENIDNTSEVSETGVDNSNNNTTNI